MGNLSAEHSPNIPLFLPLIQNLNSIWKQILAHFWKCVPKVCHKVCRVFISMYGNSFLILLKFYGKGTLYTLLKLKLYSNIYFFIYINLFIIIYTNFYRPRAKIKSVPRKVCPFVSFFHWFKVCFHFEFYWAHFRKSVLKVCWKVCWVFISMYGNSFLILFKLMVYSTLSTLLKLKLYNNIYFFIYNIFVHNHYILIYGPRVEIKSELC